MGIGFGIKCKECDYKNQFFLGIGMLYSPSKLEDIDSEFSFLGRLIKSDEIMNLTIGLLKDKNGKLVRYGHKLFTCSICGEFYERFFYQIHYDGGVFVPEYKCSKCNVPLSEVEYKESNYECDSEVIDFSKYACPKCGNHSLYEDKAMRMMWD